MKAPFPWFGGKRRVAPVVWERFGDVQHYCEPFAGSLAVLLERPGWHEEVYWAETVNDKDGFVANAWRAILHDPEQTAHYADWPVNENDLHARHAWLVERRADLTARVEGDPDYYDAKIAGWWLWGIACWIGGGWCSGQGSWRSVVGEDGVRMLVHSGSDGQGVQRQLVHLGDPGQGVRRKLVHLGPGRGVQRKRVHLGLGGDPGDGDMGLLAWLEALSARLRRVRVACGDWSRVVTPAALMATRGEDIAVFLDPPYSIEERDAGPYSVDSAGLAEEVAAWALDHGDRYKIALCGYEGEHEGIDFESHGWETYAWETHGGYAVHGNGRGRENRARERIWFSPRCRRAMTLFSELAAGGAE